MNTPNESSMFPSIAKVFKFLPESGMADKPIDDAIKLEQRVIRLRAELALAEAEAIQARGYAFASMREEWSETDIQKANKQAMKS